MGMKMLNMRTVVMMFLLRFHVFPMLDEHETAWLSTRQLTETDGRA